MKKVKGIALLIFAAVFIAINMLCAAAITIDGNIDDENEWKNVPMINVAEDGSDCDIATLIVKYDLQKSKNILYIAFQTIQNHPIDNNFQNCGFKITINNSSPIELFFDKTEFDKSLYNVSAKSTQYNDGICMEARITFREGVDEEINFNFTAFDSLGAESRQFSIVMKDKPVVETTTSKSSAKKSSSNQSKKTTKGKTTSLKYSTAVYSTVDPNKYTKTDVRGKGTDTLAENIAQGDISGELSSTFPEAGQAPSSTGKIVLKTVAVGIAVVATIAFSMTLGKKRKNIND